MNATDGLDTAYEAYCETHLRHGWCGTCGEVPMTIRPSGRARLWFCTRCGHFLGEEPEPHKATWRPKSYVPRAAR